MGIRQNFKVHFLSVCPFDEGGVQRFGEIDQKRTFQFILFNQYNGTMAPLKCIPGSEKQYMCVIFQIQLDTVNAQSPTSAVSRLTGGIQLTNYKAP